MPRARFRLLYIPTPPVCRTSAKFDRCRFAKELLFQKTMSVSSCLSLASHSRRDKRTVPDKPPRPSRSVLQHISHDLLGHSDGGRHGDSLESGLLSSHGQESLRGLPPEDSSHRGLMFVWVNRRQNPGKARWRISFRGGLSGCGEGILVIMHGRRHQTKDLRIAKKP